MPRTRRPPTHPRRDLYPRQVFQHWRIGGKTWRARTCYIEAAPGLQIEARFVEPVLRVMRVGEDAVEATLSPPGLEGRLCVHLLGHEEDAALWERTLSSGKHLVQDLPPAAAQALLVRWEVREVTAAAGVKAMDAVEEAAAG